MAPKVDEKVFARIVQLKNSYGLTSAIIAQRLGISIKTVQIYLRANRLGATVEEAYRCSSLPKK